MNGDEREDRCRNQENVGHVEARQRERADGVAAAQQACQPLADKGNLADDVGAHRSREVCLLIPGQQIAGKAHAQHEQRQRGAGDPQQFAPALERPIEKRLQKMEHAAR